MKFTAALRRGYAGVVALALSVFGLAIVAPVAQADTAPPEGTPSTVSADALPTWQVNGVVWSQVVVGNTAYATGSFTQARPPGVAVGGAGSITANNIFAYDVTSGNPVTSFNHSLNGQGQRIVASPDGSRIYVIGDFTAVDGQAHGHIAAFNSATEALVSGFTASLSATAQAATASNSTVWVGGNFFKANGKGRTRLAAFAASNGSLLPWSPSADDGQVSAMALAPDGSRVIVGGKFTTINGSSARGMGSVDATSGANLPWAASPTIDNSGDKSAITTLTTDGTNIYGSGFAFGTGNFEGEFAADPDTGKILFVNDCHGDTYDVFPRGQVLYTVSHAHDCRWIGGFPQSDENWSINMRHALAFTTYPTGTNVGPDNYGWNYNGLPASSLLQWFPEVAIGSYTGQSQAAWSVAGNDNYVVLGGEFPRVNGAAQQGLVRFAIPSLATNKRGPVRASGAPTPSAVSFAAGSARVSWEAAYDMDNASLTYDVYRSGNSTPVYTTTQDSNYWTHPMMGFVDTSVASGVSYKYTVKVRDPFGNQLTLPATNQVTANSGIPSAYEGDVTADGASAFWRLGESSGTTVYDHAGFNDATANTGVTRGVPGAINGDPDQASSFSGGSDGVVVSPLMSATPNFSLEAWVKTTTSSGGKIIGYGNAVTGDSTSYDRHVYMDNAGHIVFGVYPGSARTIASTGPYNDGAWHQIVATLSETSGMALYVDGKRVATDSGTTSAQAYSGYWRIGGDNLNGWPSQPASARFAGAIDDVAVYPTALTLVNVQQHYVDSGRTVDTPPRPSDTYGQAVYDSSPELYWRLGERIGTTAKDSGPYGADGVYSGGYVLGQAPAITGTSNTSVRFNGANGTAASAGRIAGPQVYSEEMWFNTTTTRGGKLIGLGDQQSGNSGNYDRHVYMDDGGHLTFGVWAGTASTVTSPNSYNDGNWHYLVATQSGDGMKLYVDGVLVGTNPQTGAQSYSGYWRVGGDTSWGGSSNYFSGLIDEVAVYSRALDQATINRHYVAGGGHVTNQSPTAAMTDTTDGLQVSVDGSSSGDPDGSIASYSWDWGDGSEPGSGKTATHVYSDSGTYTIALTVTDDLGGTDTDSVDVTVSRPNQKPTAQFTATVDGLGVSVDGSGSSDPDGNIAAYSWDWGDGTSAGSGATASHEYGSSGTYDVKLTVTDDDGGTSTVTKQVDVSDAPAPLAVDSFVRTVTSGWGSADVGGPWTRNGSAGNFAVADGYGQIRMGSPGAGPSVLLGDVSSDSTDLAFQFGVDMPSTGGGTYITGRARVMAGGDNYYATARLLATGGVTLILGRSSADDVKLATTKVAGLDVLAADRLNFEIQASGTSPTTLRAKIWKAGTTEPDGWTASVTDSSSALQGQGAIGLMAYLSGTSTNAPVTASFSNLQAVSR